jgi:chromosome segregation ATPase
LRGALAKAADQGPVLLLRRQLQAALVRAGHYERDNVELREHTARLSAGLEAERQQQTTKLATAEAEVARLSKANAALHLRVERLSRDLAARGAALGDKEAELGRARAEAVCLRADVSESRAACVRAEEAYRQRVEETARKEEDALGALRGHVQELEVALARSEAGAAGAKAAVDYERHARTAVEQECRRALQRAEEEHKRELAAATAAAEAAEARTREAEAKLRAHAAAHAAAAAATGRAQGEGAEAECASLRVRVVELERRVAEAEARARTAETAAEDAKGALSVRDAAHGEVVAVLRRQAEGESEAVRQAGADRAAAEGVSLSLRAALVQTRKQLEQETRALANAVAAERRARDADGAVLRGEAEELRRGKERYKAMLARQACAEAVLRAQLQETREELARANARMEGEHGCAGKGKDDKGKVEALRQRVQAALMKMQ